MPATVGGPIHYNAPAAGRHRIDAGFFIDRTGA